MKNNQFYFFDKNKTFLSEETKDTLKKIAVLTTGVVLITSGISASLVIATNDDERIKPYDELIKYYNLYAIKVCDDIKVYLCSKEIDKSVNNVVTSYYNYENNKLIYVKSKNKSLISTNVLVEELSLVDYLIAYNKVQSTYTKKEILEIVDMINEDYKYQANDKKTYVKK